MRVLKYSLFLVLLVSNSLIAQDQKNDDIEKPLPSIILESEGSLDSIVLKWIPTSGNDYLTEITYGGWVLERETISITAIDSTLKTDGSYDYVLDTIVQQNSLKALSSVSEPFVSKDSTWFANNANLQQGMVGLMGQVLYNPEAEIFSDDISTVSAIYNYLKYSYLNVTPLMPHLGLGYVDKDVEEGKKYRYTLYAKSQPDQKTSVIIEAFPIAYAKNDDRLILKAPNIMIPGLTEQPTSVSSPTSIVTRAKSYKDSIVVKWIPNDATVFTVGLQDGYVVKRLEGNEEIVLDTIRPWSKEKYESYRNSKDSTVLASSMIVYGDFAAESTNMVEASDAFNNRYAYGAYMFELSQKAASAMGLRYVDTDVKSGKKYEYIIESLNQEYRDVTGYTAIENVPRPLPKPIDVKFSGLEYAIEINFDKEKSESWYSYYFVDRSEDGKSWTPTHNKPILFADANDIQSVRNIYIDSVGVLYKDYYYRIRGRDAFGEYGAYAQGKAQAVDLTPPPAVWINPVEYVDGLGAVISWKDTTQVDDFDGYIVQLSDQLDGTYEDVSKKLSKDTRSYTYTPQIDVERSYYFKVKSTDIHDNASQSIGIQLNVVDSIPPTPPIGLKGFIDDDGMAYLTWEHSPERDLAGYRVYFSNSLDNEFSQLTKDMIEVNLYQDTIALDIINEDIYYVVEAQDDSYNRSEFSEPIKLQRPDLIPPVTPAMLSPLSISEGIKLTWNLSSSHDVVHQHLYRRLLGEEEWTMIQELDAKVDTYIDSLVQYETIYEYSIQVKDDAELLSERSLPLQGRRYYENGIEAPQNLNATFEENNKTIVLVWDQYTVPDDDMLRGQDFRYQVYRAEKDGAMERIIQLSTKDPRYADTAINTDSTYNYAVQIVFADGKASDMSQISIVDTTIKEKKEKE